MIRVKIGKMVCVVSMVEVVFGVLLKRVDYSHLQIAEWLNDNLFKQREHKQKQVGIVTGKQIGRASCRERV